MKGKTRIIAKFLRTDLVICSHSREGETPSYSRINTVQSLNPGEPKTWKLKSLTGLAQLHRLILVVICTWISISFSCNATHIFVSHSTSGFMHNALHTSYQLDLWCMGLQTCFSTDF